MKNEDFYDEVAKELQDKAMVPGVWAKAFADSEGNIDRARALYIKYRVKQLEKAERQRIDEDRKATLTEVKKQVVAKTLTLTHGLLALAWGGVTVFFALGTLIAIPEGEGIGFAVFYGGMTWFFGYLTYRALN